MKIDKDAKFITEAYAKVRESLFSKYMQAHLDRGGSLADTAKPGWTQGLDPDNTDRSAKGKISPQDFTAAKNKLRDGLNKLAKGMNASDISDVVYTLTQYPTFSPEAKALRLDLEEELDSCQDDMQLRANWPKISKLGMDLLNATIWSYGESVEEPSSSKLTMEHLVKAINTSLQPYRHECEVCYLGQVMDALEKMGFKLWGHGPDRESFDKCWEEFVSKNAYCYDMNASDDPYEDREHTENKIEKNGPGECLFMEGSGRGPDAYLACEFAKKNGYKKVILNGLS